MQDLRGRLTPLEFEREAPVGLVLLQNNDHLVSKLLFPEA